MAIKTYNRISLSQCLLDYFDAPTHHNQNQLFSQILIFSNVKAKAHLRPYASWWNENAGDTFIMIEELASYAIFSFLNYLESERFNRNSWSKNPMANLNRFFKCRFLERCRSEMTRLKRQVRIDISESGWDHVEGNHPSPEQELLVAEIQTAFDNAIVQLPTVQKVAVVGMRQGKKAGQVAFENGIMVSEVYEASRKARSRLRNELHHFQHA